MIRKILVIFLNIVILTGCFRESEINNDKSYKITISIIVADELKSRKSINVKHDTKLYDILSDNYSIKFKDDMLTEIENYRDDPKENIYWTYKVNGEMPMKGIKDYKIKEESNIEFILSEIK
ncbi:MAG: DUF4430 domain-containing protein [Helcococcus sp.]|nr:DUF4430 domain-containing protein [Helcococcus sp.]